MRVLLLSRYGRRAPSSRLRYYQHLPWLAAQGANVSVRPLLSDRYLLARWGGDPVWMAEAARGYARRLRDLMSARRFDLFWVEYEALPWLPAWVERVVLGSRVPAVLEYDDAVFHRYDSSSHPLVRALLGSKIARLMREATTVVTGNPYLAEYARQAGARRVEIVPTAIDTERVTVPVRAARQPVTIGWIGTPTTTRYLRAVEGPLREACRDGRARVLLVGAAPIELPGVPVVARPWSEEMEPADLAEMDIGVMPLPDSPWERGKSGFKLLQYMAAGCPVVASPVGVNNSIVKPGVNGFLASTEEQWRESLAALSESASLRQRLGNAGRRLVEAEYSASVTAPKVLRILREAAARNS